MMNWAELVAKLANDDDAAIVQSIDTAKVETSSVQPAKVEEKKSMRQIVDECEELECHEFEFDPACESIAMGEWE